MLFPANLRRDIVRNRFSVTANAAVRDSGMEISMSDTKTVKSKKVDYSKWGYIFILPFFVTFAIFQLIPLGSTIFYSFFETVLNKPKEE